ncbi:uncharacterized protein LOC101847774, partial [Aplysia californica]|uniref:Uncharacterized protein LOC101847774 n=1 Tax=Aplysia californica TaxID=6500 RepID=A0ABM0JA72_APLCA
MDSKFTLYVLLVAVVATCLFVGEVRPAALPDKFSEEEVRKMERFSGDVMGCANIPALGLGVVRGDATFSTGLGVADMATGHAADKRTMFTLGSTAKAFVPYILAEIMNGKENHDGRIQWNSTLREILHHDRDLEVPEPWSDMTLNDMLVYMSGSSAADLSTMAGLPDDVTREDLIRRMRFLPETEDFKKSSHFTNYMYTVAGHLAERMSGMGWEDLVKARVLDKQDMNESSFAPEGMSHPEAARPYRYHQGMLDEPFKEQNMSLFDLRPSEPVGSLMASADDITKWLRHLLHNLRVRGNDSGINLLIGEAFHQWVTVPEDHKDGLLSHSSEVALGYGMGWFSSTYRGLRRYSFRGSLYAFTSQIWLFPDVRVAVYLALSGPGSEHAQRALEAIMYNTADVALRKEPWMDTEKACCCQEMDYDYKDYYYDEDHDTAPMEQRLVQYLAPVDRYVGKYGNGFVGNLIVEANEAGILNLMLGKNLKGELTPEKAASKMKFMASDWLSNTEEWSMEKMVEFLYKSGSGAEGEGKPYDIVRLHVSDALFYDFERGKLFETMLLPEESEEVMDNTDKEVAVAPVEDNNANVIPQGNAGVDDHMTEDNTSNNEVVEEEEEKKVDVLKEETADKVPVDETIDPPKEKEITESSPDVTNEKDETNEDKDNAIVGKDDTQDDTSAKDDMEDDLKNGPLNDDNQASSPEEVPPKETGSEKFLGSGRDTHSHAQGGYEIDG